MLTLHTDDACPMKLESDRRKTPRRTMNGGAMAVFSDGPGPGTLSRVEVLDASWTGIGVRSPAPVMPGSSVSLVPESPMWPRQTGIVVRCEPDGQGAYRVGIMSKRRSAVA
ncbi:MAG: hypothetical protein SFY69_01910 [Planctomycetota bacterium]|nr:hypothetical protein [Planctomycetota bacterium]